jgi:hypothetical protein
MSLQQQYLEYLEAVEALAEANRARDKARARKLIRESLLFEAVLPMAAAEASLQLGGLPGEPVVVNVTQEGEDWIVCLGFYQAGDSLPFGQMTVRIPIKG